MFGIESDTYPWYIRGESMKLPHYTLLAVWFIQVYYKLIHLFKFVEFIYQLIFLFVKFM